MLMHLHHCGVRRNQPIQLTGRGGIANGVAVPGKP
jgi:hypothetical protein